MGSAQLRRFVAKGRLLTLTTVGTPALGSCLYLRKILKLESLTVCGGSDSPLEIGDWSHFLRVTKERGMCVERLVEGVSLHVLGRGNSDAFVIPVIYERSKTFLSDN